MMGLDVNDLVLFESVFPDLHKKHWWLFAIRQRGRAEA